MKLLVTGANGYLGKSLCSLLCSQGFSLTTLTRRPFELEKVQNVVADMRDEQTLRNCLYGQDVVIHLAAIAHQTNQKTILAEQLYWQVNVTQTQILAELAVKSGVKRFIYISSIKVNGETTKATPFRFDSIPQPEDLYGRSKWAAEERLKSICSAGPMELVIIRPPLIWGGEMKGNLALLRSLVRQKVYLPFGALNNRRDLVSLANLCHLISVTVSHPRAAGQILLVSDGISRTTAEIVKLITPKDYPAPRIFDCPSWVFTLLTKLPFLEHRLKKLTSNLEIDIKHTCELLNWRPDKRQM